MRKAIISSLVAIATISASSYTTQTSVKSSSSLTMANVEALTSVEFDYDNCCIFTGDFKNDICCPDSGPVLYGYLPC